MGSLGSTHTHTLAHAYEHALGKQNTLSSMWNTVIIFSSDTSPSCCRSSSGACWIPCCIQIQLFFSCFSFSYFPCAGTNICTWQELLLRKWLSVLKFLCYLLQTLSQSTSPSFRRGDKIGTQWKAQILRRHIALNNLWPSKIETATWSPEQVGDRDSGDISSHNKDTGNSGEGRGKRSVNFLS